MAQLTVLNGISIAEFVVYVPTLFVALLLSMRHGFRRNAGWLYLILFSLIRLIGAGLNLGTISDPTNIGLSIGASTLQTIGLSPLILVMLGLDGRVLESVRRSLTDRTPLHPAVLRIVGLVVLAGLILGIVGGNIMSQNIGDSVSSGQIPAYSIPTPSQIGLILMIAGYGLLVLITGVLVLHLRAVEKGEKRLLLAVGVALPFVLVRLIFSVLVIFDSSDVDFRQFGGSASYPYIQLGMAVIPEMFAVLIIEAVGLTVQVRPRNADAAAEYTETVPMTARGYDNSSPSSGGGGGRDARMDRSPRSDRSGRAYYVAESGFVRK